MLVGGVFLSDTEVQGDRLDISIAEVGLLENFSSAGVGGVQIAGVEGDARRDNHEIYTIPHVSYLKPWKGFLNHQCGA